MKLFKCKKCGSIEVFIYKNHQHNHTGLYCDDCGAWIKRLSKNEIMLAERQMEREEQNDE